MPKHGCLSRLHCHLKAHQFKFQRSELGECLMFYKEWSTDTLWLPQSGLAFLPSDNTTPGRQPLVLKPSYEPDNLKKLDTTLRKVSAYLNKANPSALEWWVSWMEEARKYVEPMEPASEGDWLQLAQHAINIILFRQELSGRSN